MTANCPHFPPTPAPTPAPQLTPPPTPKGFRDNDQDGVADAAADGTCCAFTYGNAFAGCSGATDLAGAAGCCPSDFLLRLSIQADGTESTDSYDCVSFRSQTEQWEFSCWDHVNGMGAWVEEFDPEHALCWCEADDTDHWWHYYDEDDDDDDDDGLGGGSELVMSGGLVAIGLTFT